MNEQQTLYPTEQQLTGIVTLGATREPIDDVRFITNFSTGGFGLDIAEELQQRIKKVTIMSPAGGSHMTNWDAGNWFGGEDDFCEYQHFSSAEDLEKLLLSHPPVDVVFHSAAIGDYTPVTTHEGKISSDEEELVLHLKRTPKILDKLRDHFGEQAYLVGFKLLSGVSEQELVAAAAQQIRRARTNLCVANDLRQIYKPPTINQRTEVQHPVTLVGRYGEPARYSGDRPKVARKVVERALRGAIQARNTSQTR